MVLLAILISSGSLIIIPKEYFFYWLAIQNIVIIFSMLYKSKPKKIKVTTNHYMNILVVALSFLYFPVTLLIINNYFLLILEGTFTFTHIAATFFPMVLLLFWYIYLDDIDERKKGRTFLYFLPGVSTVGIFLVFGFNGVLPYIITNLIIVLLVKATVNPYIKWIFIFFIINPKIHYIFLKLNEEKIFRDIEINISLNYDYDLIVLLCLFCLIFIDRIINFIKRNNSEKMSMVFISISLVIVTFLFEFILFSDIKIITLMLNKMILMNDLNIGELNVPNIDLILTLIEFVMTGNIYYYLTKKLEFGSVNVILSLVPYFFYIVLF
ncbi:hypothetical protein [Petrocella sp. FN5]|uniref:hypothetical protein n=1 Tax=Petrocella sp. FN5 TaxID=3032002 RepID=UPI0023DB6DF4|nr:hypothetical protein [Petrocella sp. FN5]MDF1618471.1 hypothetical protein [Petrocella sp. FN5]